MNSVHFKPYLLHIFYDNLFSHTLDAADIKASGRWKVKFRVTFRAFELVDR